MNLVFKALNDPIRRKILELLRQRDMTAGEISAEFNITGASISHHLYKLRTAGLVSSIKQGQFITYSLNTTVLDDVIQFFIQLRTQKK
jgi:DNA-binding transcriptional ArsR family regulator